MRLGKVYFFSSRLFDSWYRNKRKPSKAFFLSLLAMNASAMNWFGLTAKQLMAGAPDVDEAYADALIKHMQLMKKKEMDLTVTQPMPRGTESR